MVVIISRQLKAKHAPCGQTSTTTTIWQVYSAHSRQKGSAALFAFVYADDRPHPHSVRLWWQH